jgi:hypothetical protein
MPSQTDLDQGGTTRQWIRQFLGPSVGWVYAPSTNQFPITAGGTYIIDPSTNYIPVNTTGAVTIILPSAADPSYAGASGAQPGLFVNPPIVIVDTGGNAGAHPITIQPHAGETIMGLASIQITVNYGGYTLAPNSAQKTWNSISP